MMANTFDLIAKQILTSNSASVTFSNIPQTYNDLLVRITGRLNNAESPPFTIRFNGDTATNYSQTFFRSGYNGTIDSGRMTNSNFGAGITYAPGEINGQANTFSSNEFYIPSYTSSTNKQIGVIGASEKNDNSSGEIVNAVSAGLWRNSAAITSITFLNTNPYDWVSGSSFYLYGIKNT